MSTSIQQPMKIAQGNSQATIGLILGVVSILIIPMNVMPGVLSALACVGPAAGVLAMVTSIRGLRVARNLQGEGRKIAIAGIITGVIGLLGFLVLFTALALGPVRQMNQLIETYEAAATPQSFKSSGLQLTYPGNWQSLSHDQFDFCKQSGVECLLLIRHPVDSTNINVMRFTLDQKGSLEQVDQALWAEFVSSTPDVSLESREAVEINGQPAIRRVFSAPASNAPGGRASMLQVYMVKELDLYQMTVWAPSVDALKQHRAEVDGIIVSVKLAP